MIYIAAGKQDKRGEKNAIILLLTTKMYTWFYLKDLRLLVKTTRFIQKIVCSQVLMKYLDYGRASKTKNYSEK